jgi:hypothetical protein
MEHRLVWEKHNNAILLPWANVHHINRVKTDNRIENLEAMMNAEHQRKYSNGKDRMIRIERHCALCGKKFLEVPWRLNHGKKHCSSKCAVRAGWITKKLR